MSTIKTNNIQHVDATSANIALDSSGGLTVDTNVLVVDATNNRVGVGTASPGSLLHVEGGQIYANRNGAGTQQVLQLNNSDTTAGTQVVKLAFGSSGVTKASINAAVYGNDYLAFNTNSDTERARIDANGRLLVGTSSTDLSWFDNDSFIPQVQLKAYSLDSSSISLTRTSGSGPVIWFQAGASGNNPVNGSFAGGLNFSGYDGTNYRNAARISSFIDSTPGSGSMPGRLVFYTTPSGSTTPQERMRIHNNGDVTIAKTTTAIAGNGYVFTTQGSSFATISAGTATHHVYSSSSSTYRFYVTENGGIYNYSANNTNLSDEREKKNIANLDSTWDCLKHWELKKFHYNEDTDTDDLRYGVIAQQIAPHCPEVIADWVKQKAEDAVLDEDGNVVTPAKEEVTRMAVKEQQMMWMAIKALQEAQLRIESLESEVAALKATINP